jgi:hypothetical protein
MTEAKSRRRGAALLTLSLLAPLAAVPASAGEHAFEAPAQVKASADGHFAFAAVFTAGTGRAYFLFFTIDGRQNTDFGLLTADGFCTYQFAEGEEMVLLIEGTLLDLGQDGRITLEFGLCGGAVLTAGTVVQHPVVMATEASSWGRIKARYR